jgi:hypothetical protein
LHGKGWRLLFTNKQTLLHRSNRSPIVILNPVHIFIRIENKLVLFNVYILISFPAMSSLMAFVRKVYKFQVVVDQKRMKGKRKTVAWKSSQGLLSLYGVVAILVAVDC